MVPSTHVDVHPEPEVQEHATPQSLVARPLSKPGAPPAPTARSTARQEGTFQSSMLEYNRMKSGSRLVDALISLAVNTAILLTPIFLGLYFTDTLDMHQFTSTFLAAPPPPPAPPPPAAPTVVRAAPAKRTFENAGRLIAPTVIPKQIAMIKEEPLPPDVEGTGVGVLGGVPGGVASGSMGGVIGGVIGGVTTSIPQPIAPVAKPKGPVRVGGRVREPRLITRVEPLYPALARQTHMSGSVVIEAIISEQGDVVEMKVVSGPPLLIQAALDAVRRWKYEPTYLNDQPVPVQLNVTVMFRLSE